MLAEILVFSVCATKLFNSKEDIKRSELNCVSSIVKSSLSVA